MATDRQDRNSQGQFSLSAMLAWMFMLSLTLGFVRFTWLTRGVLTFVALQLFGATMGAPIGYLFGEDRVTGAILGALIGGAIGMLAAMLIMALLVTSIVR